MIDDVDMDDDEYYFEPEPSFYDEPPTPIRRDPRAVGHAAIAEARAMLKGMGA